MLLEDIDKLSRIFKNDVLKVNCKEICTLWAGYGRIFEVQVLFSSSSKRHHINVINKVYSSDILKTY